MFLYCPALYCTVLYCTVLHGCSAACAGKEGVPYQQHAGSCSETPGLPQCGEPALYLCLQYYTSQCSASQSPCSAVQDHATGSKPQTYFLFFFVQVNEKKFPSVIVAPGEAYKHLMLISFTC